MLIKFSKYAQKLKRFLAFRILERYESGLIGQSWKLLYLQGYRGFESHPLRQFFIGPPGHPTGRGVGWPLESSRFRQGFQAVRKLDFSRKIWLIYEQNFSKNRQNWSFRTASAGGQQIFTQHQTLFWCCGTPQTPSFFLPACSLTEFIPPIENWRSQKFSRSRRVIIIYSCPCPALPVRGQQKGTLLIILLYFFWIISYHYNRKTRKFRI